MVMSKAGIVGWTPWQGRDPLDKRVNRAKSLSKGSWGLKNMPILTRTRSGFGLLNVPAIDK